MVIDMSNSLLRISHDSKTGVGRGAEFTIWVRMEVQSVTESE